MKWMVTEKSDNTSAVTKQSVVHVISWGWVHRYLHLLCLPLGLTPYHYLVSFLISCNLYFKVFFWSDMRIATIAFFCFLFAWNIFFHPLSFSLYVSLGLKWVSCRQHKYGSCFCIHSASLCLFVGAFNLFTFKVIIDMCVLIAVLLIVLDFSVRLYSSPLLFFSLVI